MAGSGSWPAWMARVSKPCVTVTTGQRTRAHAPGCLTGRRRQVRRLQCCARNVEARSALRKCRHRSERCAQEGRLNHMLFSRTKTTLVEPDQALRGRSTSVLVNPTFHDIFGIPVQKVPEGSEVAYFALGCFWGAEKLFWHTPGVTNTAVGYAGGFTPIPRTRRSAALGPGTPRS